MSIRGRDVLVIFVVMVGFVVSAEAGWLSLELNPIPEYTSAIQHLPEIIRGRSATLGDLNGDGVLDLCVGFETPHGGIIMVLRGNPAFSQGLRRDLLRAEQNLPPHLPFTKGGAVIELPSAPDWLSIGDFDADGVQDLVALSRGSQSLLFLRGDGAGSLSEAAATRLPGYATAFAADEVNRHDGLKDIVIGVAMGTVHQLMVFQGPTGAIRATTEAFPAPEPITNIAIGRLDDDPWSDVAAAAGDVVVVFGRDRKLADATQRQSTVPAPDVHRAGLDLEIRDLVVGSFFGDRRKQLAVRTESGGLALVEIEQDRKFSHRHLDPIGAGQEGTALFGTRISGQRTDDIISCGASHQLHVMGVLPSDTDPGRLEQRDFLHSPSCAGTFGRLNADARADAVLLGEGGTITVLASLPTSVFTVDRMGDDDSGSCAPRSCTLREAINALNVAPAGSAIVMDLPLNAVISPETSLPAITAPGATLDGSVYSSGLYGRVDLDGGSCAGGCNGLTLDGGGATIRDFVIGGFSASKSRFASVLMGAGISITSHDNTVESCLIGIDENDLAVPNAYGVIIETSSNNTIGSSAVDNRNAVSGNSNHGVYLWSPDDSGDGTGNRVIGNHIGLSWDGTFAVGNGGSGVAVEMAGANIIGGASAGEGNLVSGNDSQGISLWLLNHHDNSAAVVAQNIIGLAIDGTTPLPNGSYGIQVRNQRNTLVGGVIPSMRNVVGGGGAFTGIYVGGASSETAIRGNYVGFGTDGVTPFQFGEGIGVYAHTITIGGTVPGTGNVIGQTSQYGIAMGTPQLAVSEIDVLGNVVGTNVNQDTLLASGSAAIRMANCSGCKVGTFSDPNAANTIVGSASQAPGVLVQYCSGGSVSTNTIGVSATGTPMPNGGPGVEVSNTDSFGIYGNEIAHNTGSGVVVTGSSHEVFFLSTNSIHSNGGLAADLGGDGVTLNDPGDTDSGPNGLMNYPIITGYDVSTRIATVELDTDQPSQQLAVYFYSTDTCDPSGHGEAEQFLVSKAAQTDASGSATINPIVIAPYESYLVAAVNDIDGNASEFSPCFWVPGSDIFEDDFESGDMSAWSSAP